MTHLKIITHCALSGLLSLISLSSVAQTVETVEYKYYIISPRSPYEIKPELMRSSPIRAGRDSFNGHTDWYIDWQYKSSPGPYGCQLHNVRTKAHVVHTLPALNRGVTDRQTIDVFNQFNTALTTHEKNHGNNGLLAAREIDKALNEIPPQQNCRYVSQMADDIGNRIIQKYIQADDEYDRLTRNGETEGAVIY